MNNEKIEKMKTLTKIKRDIERIKKRLSASERCENFGQKDVDKLNDKYIDISSYTDEMNTYRKIIQDFDEWCMEF